MKKKVALLGASGSIGKSTLDVLRRGGDHFDPVLFTAHRNKELLLALKKEFPAARTALSSPDARPSDGIDFIGEQGLLEAIAVSQADITVNGICGAAGLLPSQAALQAGSDLALANKETIVMAGELIFDLARRKNARIIPVDSEHSAIFKLIEAHGIDAIHEIILTASGGPFRTYTAEQLATVTLDQALNHPTWKMGPKITVDSATLANKGLEVIEAAGLFALPPDRIKIVIHPQSIVHSMVRLNDGAVYAQLSKPDMRLPIHEALHYPETSPSPFGALDFSSLTLSFEACDFKRFPMPALAYEALRGGGFLPAVYNAANETAVAAFFEGLITFLEIPRIVGYVIEEFRLQAAKAGKIDMTIETIRKQDTEARTISERVIRELYAV